MTDSSDRQSPMLKGYQENQAKAEEQGGKEEKNTSAVRGSGIRENSPMAMIPKLQMSTLGPYSLRVTTSGAIQYGVPTMVVRLACAGSAICAQNPKSAITHEKK